MISAQRFWVDIENFTGQKMGAGPLHCIGYSQVKRLSACGDFTFDVSAADKNVGALREKRLVVCRYIDSNGNLQEFGSGIIDKIVKTFASDGSAIYRVSGNDLGRELSYRSVGTLRAATSEGYSTSVNNLLYFVFFTYYPGWTITLDGLPFQEYILPDIYLGFDGESVLTVLSRAAKKTGQYWVLGPGRTFGWLTEFAPSGMRACQHVDAPVAAELLENLCIIESVEEETDAAELITRILPRGAGNGSAIVTLAQATASAPAGYTLDTANNYLSVDAAESEYGQIERVVEFKEIGPLSNTTADIISAANMLLQASVQHLQRYSSPAKFYRIKLAQSGQLLFPGTTILVEYQKVIDSRVIFDLRAAFNIVESKAVLDASGMYSTEIVVTTTDRLPESDSNILANQIMDGKVLSAHQQLGASTDTLTWRDEMDSGHGASMRFWLGDEYTSIQRAVFRFRIQPLRSTVKSVGGESTSTESGGGGTETSSSGGGAEVSSAGSAHAHAVVILSGSGGTPVTYASGGLYTPGGDGGSHPQITVDNPAHTHSITIDPHTHEINIPEHAHSLTANVIMEYGIFEESGANTLALSNLVLKLNGGADLRTHVEDIGNGWFAIELTEYGLCDAAFRPAQENNELAITTATEKTARIEAQLTIRGVVQAVNYQ